MRRSELLCVVAVAVIIIGFFGCTPGTTTPTQPPNYFPMAPGNYWVYDVYQLDTTGQRTGTPTRDSSVMGSPTAKDGRQAYPLYTFSSDGSIDTSYYSKDAEGNIHWYMVLSDGGILDSDETINLGARWVKIVPAGSENNWTILDTTLLDVQISDDPPIKTNITVKVTGRKTGTESVSIAGKSYQAQKYELIADIMPSLPVFTAKVVTTRSLVDKIGEVATRSTVNLNFLGQQITEGTERVLIRHSVK